MNNPNNITITIQFCEEDRKRLDAIIAGKLLPAQVGGQEPAKQPQEAPEKVKADNSAPVQEKAQETPKTEPTQAPAEPKPEPEKAAAPTVTLAQIQQKVVQLATAGGGTKKAAVREVIKQYAGKVSEIPTDKLGEVWEKLTALEQEG